MTKVGARPPMHRYIAQLWERRHFIWFDSRMRAFGSIKDTVLGKIWLVLQPFLDAGIYFLIFGFLLGTSRGIESFLGYLVIGVTMFSLSTKAMNSGATIIPMGKNLMSAFSFPRASLVFSFGIRNLIDAIPTLLTTLVFILVMPTAGGHLTLLWLLFPLVILLQFVFNLGLAFVTAAVTSLLPDFKFIWPLISRFWFYASGVFFSLDRFAGKEIAGIDIEAVMRLNPGWGFLDVSRDILLYNTVPDMGTVLYLVAVSFILVLFGFWFFWIFEERYGQKNER